MTEENKAYIHQLKVADTPWHRLTTACGRGTDSPAHLIVLEQMRGLASVKKSLYAFITNLERQDALWYATPFGMVSLNRILERALMENDQNPVARFLTRELLDFFTCTLQCFHDGDGIEHASLLPCFSDLLKEEYLWSEEYDEKKDEMHYGEDKILSAGLFYSFYYYSWQAVLAYRGTLEQEVSPEFFPKIAAVLRGLQGRLRLCLGNSMECASLGSRK